MKSAFARWRTGAQPAIPPALLKNLLPIVVLAIGITAMVMMYFWRDQANYKPVFGAREKVAVTDMMATLDAEHIPYRLHPDSGQVLVPDAMLGKVRMLLASKGVTAQLPAGLELMDKNDPLGVSQFVQDVRFRRGLEGELAQSIMTMDAIASARVHLSIAKSTSFVASDGDKSSASIVVAVKPGRTLAPEQIAAVINMVAGSVASLAPTRVSLVDQSGNLLSAHIDLADGFDASAAGNEGAKRFQDEIRRNVTGLLGPVIGEDNFKLSVTAAVDNDRIEETLEKYGEAPKVTSEAMREEQERNRNVAGIPGSLSNRPPAAAVPGPTGAAGAVDGGAPKPEDGTARKNATTRQYAYDRSITQIKRSRGRLEKVSVAVVLNSTAAPDAKAGWTPAELANIEKMLRSGLGINAQRGDSLSLTTLPFPAKQPVAQWWEERDTVVDFSSWLLYALGAVLGYFLVLRPLLRLLTSRLAPPELKTLEPAVALAGNGVSAGAGSAGSAAAVPALGAVSGAPALEGAAAATGGDMPVVPLLENYNLPPPGSAVDVMVDHLKVLAEKEPERVAEVVKQWMQKNGRTQQQ
ncbi:flagellar basal-body MS-ring/collar protein FliF [Janthinobacterium psychrotolerans]|uniref:Flagellar M-ring protein n=1 Tax=Janthinobacterium psychrotolerans TaxID=1747903 RepID=A0A1A7C5E0_9BURK|nr:flagellar basal-body MS-ring/collar protein FliF [Janthinobacterium psychrotolerans]OBV40927.1 flagellar M-ring protein FliF [Janthinobacterium psychrotolerans]